MSDDLRREVAELEARLDVLRRALRESEPDALESAERDAERRRAYYGGGGAINARSEDGRRGGVYQPPQGERYGG